MSRRRFLQKISVSLLGLPWLGSIIPANGKPGGHCSVWTDLVDYARWSPSPHNVQPWKLRQVSELEADLYYDTTRLLPATDPGSRFTILGMGMFITCLDVAAADLGYSVKAGHSDEQVLDAGTTGLKYFARLSLVERTTPPDVDRELILKRRTSRLQYDGRPVSPEVVAGMSAVAEKFGFKLSTSDSPELIASVTDLNRETLFHDLDEVPVREELSKWIRTTDVDAAAKKDGLWSKCMGFRGKLMHNFFFHPERFRAVWKRKVLGRVYEKPMKGTRRIAWISGSFANRHDWLKAGEMLQHLWLEITKSNVYLHPFGSVITNVNALRKFESYVNHNNQDGELWLLFRVGYSNEPPRSFRLGTQDILIQSV